MKEALRAQATVGEVCNALREVWGDVRPAGRLLTRGPTVASRAVPGPPRPSELRVRPSTPVPDSLVELRRDLHAHPELAWQEQRTTAVVAERLEAAGIDIQLLAKSGLVAELGDRRPARWSRSAPTSTRCRWTTAPTTRGEHRRRRRARLRPRRAHRRPARRRAGAGRAAPGRRRSPDGSGCCSSPPRRSCPAVRWR